MIGLVNMAETMTQVVANAPPTLDGKIYKLYSCDGKKDFPLMKESAGTQTSIQLNGRILTPDVENKENQNGEVSLCQNRSVKCSIIYHSSKHN